MPLIHQLISSFTRKPNPTKTKIRERIKPLKKGKSHFFGQQETKRTSFNQPELNQIKLTKMPSELFETKVSDYHILNIQWLFHKRYGICSIP